MQVVPLYPAVDIPAMLRLLAAQIESGEVVASRVTVVLPDGNVRAFGAPEADITPYVVHDCQAAIFRVMSVVQAHLD